MLNFHLHWSKLKFYFNQVRNLKFRVPCPPLSQQLSHLDEVFLSRGNALRMRTSSSTLESRKVCAVSQNPEEHKNPTTTGSDHSNDSIYYHRKNIPREFFKPCPIELWIFSQQHFVSLIFVR